MAAPSSEEYIYRHTGNGVYIRKCFGTEVMECQSTENCDGLTHITLSAEVRFNGISPTQTCEFLEPRVCAAWITLRHIVPEIACKSFKLPTLGDDFAFRYKVPQSTEDAYAWSNDTIFFSGDVGSLRDVHRSLKDNRWWTPSSDHYVAELHLSPWKHAWNISMSLIHNFIDARAAFTLMDLYLKYLAAELDGRAKPVTSIKWGAETVRLHAPGPFIKSIIERGCPPKLYSNAEKSMAGSSNEPGTKTSQPPTVRPWLYACTPTEGHGDISHIVTFSRGDTAKLHAISKKHERTITQLFSALYVLAHSEMALRSACADSIERFGEVIGSFETATHYLVPLTTMCHRHKLPEECHTFESHVGSPLHVVDGTALLFPINVVRALFKIDKTKNSVQRVNDRTIFWDGLVSAIASAWKAVDHSFEAYITREFIGHSANQKLDSKAFNIPALMISSIGDMGRLGLLNDFLPGTSSPSKTTSKITVEDIVFGIRTRIPMTINSLYEYNGQLSSHASTAGEYTTYEDLQLEAEILKEWIDIL